MSQEYAGKVIAGLVEELSGGNRGRKPKASKAKSTRKAPKASKAKSTRKVSAYNLFVKENINSMSGSTPQERMKQVAELHKSK